MTGILRDDDLHIKLRVNEIFGPTIQGEGKHRGQVCYFIRLYDCNLACKWCDTPYTWVNSKTRVEKHDSQELFPKHENMREMTVKEITDELLSKCGLDYMDSDTIFVISGGEPMMQQDALLYLAEELHAWGNKVHVETAGTIEPAYDLWVDSPISHWTVSPKLQHSGNPLAKRYKPDLLKQFVRLGHKVTFKFVVQHAQGMDGEDFYEVDKIVRECDIDPTQVMIMPEGIDAKAQIDTGRTLINACLKRGYGFSFRDHILLWDDKRGV